jgi:iron(III) transport system permease protein
MDDAGPSDARACGRRGTTAERLRHAVGDRIGLTLLSGAIAALLLTPLLGIALSAAEVGPQDAIGILSRPGALSVLWTSVALAAVVTAASVAIGVPLAWLTAWTDLPYRRFWTIVVALPLVVPSYVGAFVFVHAYDPELVVDELGVTLPSIYGFGGGAVVLTLFVYPYVFLTTRAALLGLDASLTDAARTLGHGRRETLRRVVLPQLLPSIAAGALLVALYTLSDFGTPAIMRVDTFTRDIFVSYDTFATERAALLSVELLALVAVILAVESRVGGTAGYASRAARGTERTRLGGWRWPATLLPAAIGTLTLLIPVGVLLGWLVRADYQYAAESLAFQPSFAVNTVWVAAVAAVAAGAVAVPVAQASVAGGRLATLFDRATYVGFAVPGIVLGIALVELSTRVFPAVYQTLPLLVFAYVVRFLPQAVGTIRSSSAQVDAGLVDAALTLGHTRLGAFRRVTLPLLAPGALAGAALVFLTTMKELPATLLLHPTGFDTLVTYIWRVQGDVYYGRAALPTLALIGISMLSMLVILSQEGDDGG